MNDAPATRTAIFAAGCFWGVETAFRAMPGVLDVEVGYTGGHTENPTYAQVSSMRTGHVEAARVTWDPALTTHDALLACFFACHDPTSRWRQGWSVGPQYRSVIFVGDAGEDAAARAACAAEAARRGKKRLATEIRPAAPFWRAEEHHQCYLQKLESKPWWRRMIGKVWG